MSRIGKAIETEKSISGCLGLGGHLGVEEWGMSANGYRVCFRRGENILKLKCGKGLPWWRSVENLPANAGDTGFEPWSGKIPHAAEQLSPCDTTTEPALWSQRATTTEARAPRAHALQKEKPPQ